MRGLDEERVGTEDEVVFALNRDRSVPAMSCALLRNASLARETSLLP